LQALLADVGNELAEPNSVIYKASKSKKQQLNNLIDDCNTDLGDLERYLLQYKSLKSAKPRLRDRLRFGIKPISQIRLKLSQHTDGLNLFLTHINTSSLGRLEQASETSAGVLDDIRAKLDDLRRQVEMGQKDVSVLDVRSSWSDLKKELVGDRVTERDVASNRDSIQEYITTWLRAADPAEDESQIQSRVNKTKRTSSMVPWSPEVLGKIGEAPSKQPATMHSRIPARDLSLSSSVSELWGFVDRDDASAASEVPYSEVTSTASESVFDSGSYPSSRTTTPDIPEDPIRGEGADDVCLSLTGLSSRSVSDGGIDSLIGELDAFVLDISRSSTPTVCASPTMEDFQPEQFENYTSQASNAVPERRIVTRTLPLTLEEAFFGGCKTKRIRGRLLPQRNDQNQVELCESTIDVHYPAGASPGLVLEVPDVGVDMKGAPQDIHFVVELVGRFILYDA
jgi:hypothetical protein